MKPLWQVGLENLQASYDQALAERKKNWQDPLEKLVKKLGRPLTRDEAYAFAVEYAEYIRS